MSNILNEKYEEYKIYDNILVDCMEVLSFYPDYLKTRIKCYEMSFISKDMANYEFQNNYMDSKLYKDLKRSGLNDIDIYMFMRNNMNSKYANLNRLFNAYVKSTIELCDLVLYIKYYSDNSLCNDEGNKLLEKYNITLVFEDGKYMILSGDIVKIVKKININMDNILLIKRITSSSDWLFNKKCSIEENTNYTNDTINKMNIMPLSIYHNNSKRLLRVPFERKEAK